HLMDDENRENPIRGNVNPVPASSLVWGSGGYGASFRLRREATISSGRVLGAPTPPMGAVGDARHRLLSMRRTGGNTQPPGVGRPVPALSPFSSPWRWRPLMRPAAGMTQTC